MNYCETTSQSLQEPSEQKEQAMAGMEDRG
jgi:hypothetical protein